MPTFTILILVALATLVTAATIIKFVPPLRRKVNALTRPDQEEEEVVIRIGPSVIPALENTLKRIETEYPREEKVLLEIICNRPHTARPFENMSSSEQTRSEPGYGWRERVIEIRTWFYSGIDHSTGPHTKKGVKSIGRSSSLRSEVWRVEELSLEPIQGMTEFVSRVRREEDLTPNERERLEASRAVRAARQGAIDRKMRLSLAEMPKGSDQPKEKSPKAAKADEPGKVGRETNKSDLPGEPTSKVAPSEETPVPRHASGDNDNTAH
jgi:hypothetical protein